MYKVSEIKELIRALDRSNLSELTLKGENKALLTLKKQGDTEAEVATQVIPPVQLESEKAPVSINASEPKTKEPTTNEDKTAKTKKTEDQEGVEHIISPMVGTFYTSSSPDSEPYVAVGDEVKEGEVVCIVEAMKLMNELEAELNGKVVEIFVENGELVEYGQPLFALQASK
ncbi:acetyl-CoA carboxylase biotin carboxyl carrier protein [Bacillus sp. FJAT-45037]|uniref:acetyl-CoA carboxylase biotin carboxyl carrier protein n=1 Tax=Bacillus sp. FJAT-45037 TaxID=2011007 RepID=UPI000C244ECB|nr:acetyl-CoA carboxylase biotin carboxyl carrier protein [Bacillus sp. FJAT-45037]